MTGLILLFFALGAAGLNSDPFWTDEVYAVGNMGGFNGERAPLQILRSVTENFPDHVPLFFWLGALWASLAGWTPFALRALPVLCGALMIAFMYRLGSQFLDRQTGLWAAALLCGSSYIVLYSHDFRMYSQLLMLAAAHCWLYWRLLSLESVGRASQFGFVLSTVALLYTHLFSLILLPSLLLYHLVCAERGPGWKRALWGWALGGLCFLPYLPVLLTGMAEAAEKSFVTSRAASTFDLLRAFVHLLGNGSYLIVTILATLCVMVLWRLRPPRLAGLLLLTLTMLLLILLANSWLGLIPLTRMRYFIIVWIPALLFVAACMSVVRLRWDGIFLLAVYCLAGAQFYRSDAIMDYAGSMVWTRLYPPMQDYVFHLDGLTREHDYLLGFTSHDYVNRDLLLGDSAADFYTQLLLGVDGAFIRDDASGDFLIETLEQRVDRQPFLLMTVDAADPPANLEEAMRRIGETYVACEVVVDRADLQIQRWAHGLAGCDHEAASIDFENGIQIVDRFGEYDSEDNLVKLVTGWQVADESQLDQFNLSLQVLTPDWEKHWQDDWHLSDRRLLKWHHAEIPTAHLPPGDYRVVAIVYDKVSLQKLDGFDQTTGHRSNIMPILSFTVTGA